MNLKIIINSSFNCIIIFIITISIILIMNKSRIFFMNYSFAFPSGIGESYFWFAGFDCFFALPVDDGIIISIIFISAEERGNAASITTTMTSIFA